MHIAPFPVNYKTAIIKLGIHFFPNNKDEFKQYTIILWPCLLFHSLIAGHFFQDRDNIGIKHGFSCINIRQVPWEVLKTESEGCSFQHLPRDLANVNALKTYVRSLWLHKNWKHLLNFKLFLALFCFAFSPMSRKRNFHVLCSFKGRALHISWQQQLCGPSTGILKVA